MYSEIMIQHFMEPQNRGSLQVPDGVGISGRPGEGPFFVLQIVCDDSRVIDAKFQSHNCGPTVACGSIITEMIKGKTFADCLSLEPCSLEEALDGIPPDKTHVPIAVLAALKLAIEDCNRGG